MSALAITPSGKPPRPSTTPVRAMTPGALARTPPVSARNEITSRMSRERQRRATPSSKDGLNFRTGERLESFCTPPTLQLPEPAESRSARVRTDASERYEREKRRLSLGSNAGTPLKSPLSAAGTMPAQASPAPAPPLLPESAPRAPAPLLPVAPLPEEAAAPPPPPAAARALSPRGNALPPPPPEPSTEKAAPAPSAPDKENDAPAPEEGAPASDDDRRGSRWSAGSCAAYAHLAGGGSLCRDDGSWCAALDARDWEAAEDEEIDPLVEVAAALVDKVVWVPAAGERRAAKVRCVFQDGPLFLLGAELLADAPGGGDGSYGGVSRFECRAGRAAFAAADAVTLLTWDDLASLPPPSPPRESLDAENAAPAPESADPSPLWDGRPVPDWAADDGALAAAVRDQAGAAPAAGAGDTCDLADVFGRASLKCTGYRETGDWTADSWDLTAAAAESGPASGPAAAPPN